MGEISLCKKIQNYKTPEKSILGKMYLDEQKPMHRIATELKMSVGKVFKYIKIYNIPVRKSPLKGRKLTEEQIQRISVTHKGKKLSEETKRKISESHKVGGIGAKKRRSDGYISIYFPDHPKSNSDGYIMEHILVMESVIGRHLYDEECVHHIDGTRHNNKKENLKLMTKKEHMSFHMKKRWEEKRKAE